MDVRALFWVNIPRRRAESRTSVCHSNPVAGRMLSAERRALSRLTFVINSSLIIPL